MTSKRRSNGQVPPCDPVAEEAILASAICEPACIDLIGIDEGHFYSRQNADIWRAILRARDDGDVNVVSIRPYLPESVSASDLARLVAQTPSVSTPALESYARIVRDKWRIRRVIDAAQTIAARGYDSEDAEALDAIVRTAFADATPGIDIRPLGSMLQASIDRARDRVTGVEKPIPVAHAERAQCLGGGYWPGVHFMISGTGTGKSQLVIEDSLVAAEAGFPTLYIGLELDAFEVGLRFLSEKARVGWSSLFRGTCHPSKLEKIENVAPLLQSLPIYADFAGPMGWPMSRLRQAIAAMRSRHPSGPIQVVLDYLQLVAPEDEHDRSDIRERIGRAAYLGRALSIEYNAAIVIVSSTARSNYNFGEAIKSCGLAIQTMPGSFKPSKTVAHPDAIVGFGKEAGEIESAADSVTVLLKWPTLYDGERIILNVCAKGRAMGASWCALIFEQGVRFVPLELSAMDELPEAPAKAKGAPKGAPEVASTELEERILATVRANPDLRSLSAIAQNTKGTKGKLLLVAQKLADDGRLVQADAGWVVVDKTQEANRET